MENSREKKLVETLKPSTRQQLCIFPTYNCKQGQAQDSNCIFPTYNCKQVLSKVVALRFLSSDTVPALFLWSVVRRSIHSTILQLQCQIRKLWCWYHVFTASGVASYWLFYTWNVQHRSVSNLWVGFQWMSGCVKKFIFPNTSPCRLCV